MVEKFSIAVIQSHIIEGKKVVLAVMDGNFLMGSMGSAVGEKITLAIVAEWPAISNIEGNRFSLRIQNGFTKANSTVTTLANEVHALF